MNIKRYKLLMNQIEAGTSAWVNMDVRYDCEMRRTIIGSVTTNDSIILEAIVKDVKGIDKSFLTSLTTADIATLGTFTADFTFKLEGPYTYVRVRKTGTAGNSEVSAFI